MNNLLVFCGPKESGKTSSANFVAGYILNRAGTIKKFNQNNNGELYVQFKYQDSHGEEKFKEEFGHLDLRRQDYEFTRYAEHRIYPHVKLYAFADTLKESVANIFGLDYKKLTGSNADKDSFTHIRWSDMEKLFPIKQPSENLFMTHREFLQFFGTNVCRTIYNDCWVNSCLSNVNFEQSTLALIDDGRFPNEVYKCKECGAKVIRLLRCTHTDDHSSEKALDSVPSSVFDCVIDNNNMTLGEKNQAIFNVMKRWGWVEGEL